MMRCPPLCGKNTKLKEEKRIKKGKRVVALEEEKVVRWAVDDKEDWGREEEVAVDHRKIEEMVLQKFLKWKKVFEKVESERIPMRKVVMRALRKERVPHAFKHLVANIKLYNADKI